MKAFKSIFTIIGVLMLFVGRVDASLLSVSLEGVVTANSFEPMFDPDSVHYDPSVLGWSSPNFGTGNPHPYPMSEVPVGLKLFVDIEFRTDPAVFADPDYGVAPAMWDYLYANSGAYGVVQRVNFYAQEGRDILDRRIGIVGDSGLVTKVGGVLSGGTLNGGNAGLDFSYNLKTSNWTGSVFMDGDGWYAGLGSLDVKITGLRGASPTSVPNTAGTFGLLAASLFAVGIASRRFKTKRS